MKIYDDLGIGVPEVLLPKPALDLQRWAVIAVDQFTSEPEYWEQVEDFVGDEPSTLQLTLPEIYLGSEEEPERIRSIRNTMRQYLRAGLLRTRNGMVYVERGFKGKIRKGLLLCLDLERYDYNDGSKSLIRATEGTIVNRLPPRMKIREGAPLELPHIVVLIDDPERTVIEPVSLDKRNMEKLYDFDLMLGGGRLAGYGVNDESGVVAALRRLAEPSAFASRCGIGNQPLMLFAVGDGNHSLAAAKAVWEKVKPQVGMDHPARYALAELENIHDEGIRFEPIHRILYGVERDFMADLRSTFGTRIILDKVPSADTMVSATQLASSGHGPRFGIIGEGRTYTVGEFTNTTSPHPLTDLQPFLDEFVRSEGAEEIDYVHGEDTLLRMCTQPEVIGIYLPVMNKSELFRSVVLNGALPRKAFSMGEARTKRFYMEARRLFV